MAMNLELYDELKGEIGEKAARMIAEAIPSERLATKENLEHGLGALRNDMEVGFERLRVEMRAQSDRLEARLTRWMLAFFVPLWLGVYGTLAAVVITLLVRG